VLDNFSLDQMYVKYKQSSLKLSIMFLDEWVDLLKLFKATKRKKLSI
jgi:hypothetical protein